MIIEYDDDKDAANLAKHGVSFAQFAGFDGETVTVIDGRHDYREPRYRTIGRIGGKLHMIVFVMRGGAIRLISFRRAHEKERRRYDR